MLRCWPLVVTDLTVTAVVRWSACTDDPGLEGLAAPDTGSWQEFDLRCIDRAGGIRGGSQAGKGALKTRRVLDPHWGGGRRVDGGWWIHT